MNVIIAIALLLSPALAEKGSRPRRLRTGGRALKGSKSSKSSAPDLVEAAFKGSGKRDKKKKSAPPKKAMKSAGGDAPIPVLTAPVGFMPDKSAAPEEAQPLSLSYQKSESDAAWAPLKQSAFDIEPAPAEFGSPAEMSMPYDETTVEAAEETAAEPTASAQVVSEETGEAAAEPVQEGASPPTTTATTAATTTGTTATVPSTLEISFEEIPASNETFAASNETFTLNVTLGDGNETSAEEDPVKIITQPLPSSGRRKLPAFAALAVAGPLFLLW